MTGPTVLFLDLSTCCREARLETTVRGWTTRHPLRREASLAGSFSDPGADAPWSYAIDWGNGVGRNNGTYMEEVKDVNGDGILDVVLKFRRYAVKQTGVLTSATTSLVLLADLADGRQLRGEYGVRVVP